MCCGGYRFCNSLQGLCISLNCRHSVAVPASVQSYPTDSFFALVIWDLKVPQLLCTTLPIPPQLNFPDYESMLTVTLWTPMLQHMVWKGASGHLNLTTRVMVTMKQWHQFHECWPLTFPYCWQRFARLWAILCARVALRSVEKWE